MGFLCARAPARAMAGGGRSAAGGLVGIIGCGAVSRLMHLPALLHNKHKFNIVSLYDINDNAVKLTKKLFNSKLHLNFAGRPSEITSNPDIDAIAVLTSTSSHLKYTLQALRNKKHVFLKNPLL